MKGDPLAIKVGTTPGLLEMFQNSNEKLEGIQRSLDLYLDQKRLGFPRFNFLGDGTRSKTAQSLSLRAIGPILTPQ